MMSYAGYENSETKPTVPNNERLLTPEQIDGIRFNKPVTAVSPRLPSYVSVLLREQDTKTASLIRKEVLEEIKELFADDTAPVTFVRARDNKSGVEECCLIIKSEWVAKLEKEG